MDVHHLTYIITIAECKNMTKAAQKLYVSQSTLSQYLGKLEQELETPLFNRAKGELLLTPAGKLYVKTAREVVDMQQKLYREIAALNRKGHISIGATSNFALEMLADIVPAYKKKYPDVTLEISELSLPALKSMIQEEGLDLGIAATADPDAVAGQTKVLRKEPLYLAVSEDSAVFRELKMSGKKVSLTGKNPVGGQALQITDPEGNLSLQAAGQQGLQTAGQNENPSLQTISRKDLIRIFEKESFISTKSESSIRLVTDPLFSSLNITPTIICETNHMSSTLQMVANNVGVAFVGKSCAAPLKNIRYLDINPGIFRYNVLITRKNWPAAELENELTAMITEYFL